MLGTLVQGFPKLAPDRSPLSDRPALAFVAAIAGPQPFQRLLDRVLGRAAWLVGGQFLHNLRHRGDQLLDARRGLPVSSAGVLLVLLLALVEVAVLRRQPSPRPLGEAGRSFAEELAEVAQGLFGYAPGPRCRHDVFV